MSHLYVGWIQDSQIASMAIQGSKDSCFGVKLLLGAQSQRTHQMFPNPDAREEDIGPTFEQE